MAKRSASDHSGSPASPPRRQQTIELEAKEVASQPRPSNAGSEARAETSAGDRDTARIPPGNAGLLVAAGAVGAAGALLVIGVLSLAGILGNTSSTLENRLTGIEAQLRELALRPAPARNDTRAMEGLTARVERLEKTASAPPPPLSDPALANRLASAEAATKAFADDIGSLNRRVDDLSAAMRELRNSAEAIETAVAELQKAVRALSPAIDKSELESIAGRIAALERAAGLMETEIGKRATVTSDRAVRFALATSALRAAVERGEPFAAELAAARPLAASDAAFTALEPFAAIGVPADNVLARELAALVPALRNAANALPPEAGFFERLKSSAGRLIRIRPVEDVASDEPAAVIARIELKAAGADIAGALADLAKLPDPMRAPAKAWIERAQARAAAIQTSRQLAADAINALGKVTH